MQQIQDPRSSSHLFSCPLIAFGYYPGVKKAQVRADWTPQTLSSKCVCVRVCVCVCICIQLVAHLEGMLTVSTMCGKCCLIPKNIYFCFMITPKPLTVFSSVQFSHWVMSDSLRPHESQHARPPCPSPTHGVYSNSCPSSRWCHPAISSSVIPFSSWPQSLPASGSFPMSQLFTWGGQSTGVSASASVLPVNTQNWSPLGWAGWISLQSEGLSRVFSNTIVQKHQFFGTQLSSQSNSHIHLTV